MKAQKKPVVIDYYEVKTLDFVGLSGLTFWIDSLELTDKVSKEVLIYEPTVTIEGYYDIRIKTLEGESYMLTLNDVVIRGIKGEYYPCKKDIFEQTYDKIKSDF